MVKSMAANGLGNTADADITAWPETVLKVKAAYPEALLVVPGHGNPGGLILLDHTIDILQDYRDNQDE
jgi:metallo-beta-lactamase class B